MLASLFIMAGVDVLKNMEPRVQAVEEFLVKMRSYAPFLPKDDATLVKANAIVHIAAGSALAANIMPRISSIVLAGSLVPTTVGAHHFWDLEDPKAKGMQRTQFLKNLAIAGGLIFVAGSDA